MERNHVTSVETTYLGDSKEMNGEKFMLKVQDNNEYNWKTTYSFSNGMSSETKFTKGQSKKIPSPFNDYLYTNFDASNQLTKYFEHLNIKIRSGKYYLKEYNDYMNIYMSRNSFGNNMSLTEFLKIKVPENTYIEVTKEGDSLFYTPNNFPSTSTFILPKIELGGKTYFTILNDIDSSENEKIEYEGITGIVCVPNSIFDIYGTELKISRENVLYGLEIGNDIDRQILGITYREKENCFVLAVKEQDKIWLHVIERETGNLVIKKEVASLPSNTQWINYNFFHQDDYIMVEYKYKVSVDNQVSYYREVAAFELKGNSNLNVLLHYQYLTELIRNKDVDSLDMINFNIWDMKYQDGNIFILGTKDLFAYGDYGIIIMTINKEGVQYLGKIRNSMIEDNTIGRHLSYTEILIDYPCRSIEELKFLK
jgi:hypothetical protein